MIPRIALAAILFVVFATATTAVQPQRPALHPPAARPTAAIATSTSWTTYHHDNAHTGTDPAAPAMATIRVTPGWTETTLDEEVFGEPLIYNGNVYAATLNNTVYALDAATGAVTWSTNLGAPMTGGWTCGNVSPQGILGTPVIDGAGGRIYAAALLSDGIYRVFGLNLTNGTIVLTTPIPGGPSTDWKIQQQRGALSLANGYVYVPFGGRAGDCGPYHGYVYAVPTNGSASLAPYKTTNTAGGIGIWAAGGLAIDDTTGDVFAATGNGNTGNGCGTNNVDQNDAVVRLSPTLALQDWFMPQDWRANWCGNDQDLGSAGPLLISPNLLFQSGKWGGGFLLDPNNLGHVDGQLYPSPKPAAYSQAEACLSNHGDATFGSFAYAAPFVYVECEGRGLVALQVDTAAKTFASCPAGCPAPDWNVLNGTTFGPPIAAGGAVWVANDGGGLYAFNQTTGAQIFHSAGFGINRFVTPAEAGGQVLVPSHRVIKSFTFAAVAGTVSATPASLNFNGTAPGSTSSAQIVTLHNNLNVTLNVAAAALSGANAGQYLKGTDNCSGQAIGAGGTCAVQVSFKPGGFGGFPASLSFTDDGPGSPRNVPLGGLGALDNAGHLYMMDGYGYVHAEHSSPSFPQGTTWFGWNIARSMALFPDGQGGYVMDGYGGLHPIGNAPAPTGFTYWPGWDIARQVVLAPWSSSANPVGWTLDGEGGIHPFGGAPAPSGFTYWYGWDIARALVILPDSTPSSVAGYTLDGYGGLHPFGGAPAPYGFAYWPGWDIAKGVALASNASKANVAGWTLDGFGGLHPFGTAPQLSNFTYWPYWDIARGIVPWTGSGSGGWTLDGYGGLHAFGTAPAVVSSPYWQGWDIAVSLTGGIANTGSKRHT